MKKTCLIILLVIVGSLLFTMPGSKAGLNDILLDIADTFNVNIYITSTMDTNTFIYGYILNIISVVAILILSFINLVEI